MARVISLSAIYVANRTGTVSGTLPAKQTGLLLNTSYPVSSNVLSAAGVFFGGWGLKATSTTRVRSFKATSAQTVLYAIWLPTAGTRRVIYNKSVDSNTTPLIPALPTEYYKEGATVTLPTEHTGFTSVVVLIGWIGPNNVYYCDTSIFSTSPVPGMQRPANPSMVNTFVMPTNDVVLNPWYTSKTGYRVSYLINNEWSTTTGYNYGDVITLAGPGVMASPEYTFQGWNVQQSDAPLSPVIYPPGSTFKLRSHLSIYPRRILTNRITYNVTGGVENAPTDPTIYPFGSQLVLYNGSLTKPGFGFNGWGQQPDIDVTRNPFGVLNKQTLVMPERNSNIILYANWI